MPDINDSLPPTIPPRGIPISLQSIPGVSVTGADPVVATPQRFLPPTVSTPPTPVATPPTVTPVATPDTRISLSDPGPGWSTPGQFITPQSYAPPGQPPTVGSFWSNQQQQQLRPIATNLAQTASDPRGVIPTIIQAANAYGIDPNTAIAVAQSEGLTSFLGDDGTSGGAFQLHIGGGMGDEFHRDTGLDPLNPAYERQGIWYAMKRASQEGWGAFHGAKNTGIDQWQGIRNNQRYVSAQSTPGLAYREPSQWGREPQEGWGTLPQHPLDFDAFVVKARKMQPYLSGDSALTQAYMVRAYDAYLQAFQNNQLVAMKYRSAEWQQHMQEMSDQLSLENKDIGDAMASNTGSPGEQMNAVRDLAIKYNDRPLQIAADHGPDAVTALMQARDHFGSDAAKTTGALEEQQRKKKEDADIEAEAQNNLAMWKADPANANATPQQVQAKLWEFRMKARHELMDKPDKAADPRKAADEQALDAAVEQDVKDKTDEYKAAHGGQAPSDGQIAQFRQDARRAREAKATAARAGDPTKAAELAAAEPAAKADLAQWEADPANANATQAQKDQKYQEFLANRLRGFQKPSGAEAPKVGNYTWKDSQGKQHGPAMGTYHADSGQLFVGGKAVDAQPESITRSTTGAQPDVTPPEIPPNWEGKPVKAPPGVDRGLWAAAVNYVLTGKPPGSFGRSAAGLQRAAQYQELIPLVQDALGIDAAHMGEQWNKFAANRERDVKIEAAFNGGIDGRNLIALNTVADHISLFRRYAAALKTGDWQAINGLNLEMATQTGSPEVPGYLLSQIMTGDEVVRLLTTTGGSRGDRVDMSHTMSMSNSPEQFDNAANALENYVKGRFEPLRIAYAHRDPQREAYFDNNMLTDQARAMFLSGQKPIAGEETTPPAAQPVAPPLPSGVPEGSLFSPKLQRWRDPSGKMYDAQGNPV